MFYLYKETKNKKAILLVDACACIHALAIYQSQKRKKSSRIEGVINMLAYTDIKYVPEISLEPAINGARIGEGGKHHSLLGLIILSDGECLCKRHSAQMIG